MPVQNPALFCFPVPSPLRLGGRKPSAVPPPHQPPLVTTAGRTHASGARSGEPCMEAAARWGRAPLQPSAFQAQLSLSPQTGLEVGVS